MADGGWLDRFVDSLPTRGWFKFISNHLVVPLWAWREPTPRLPGGPRPATAPGDGLQRMMNLIMPLKEKTPIGRARVAVAIGQNLDALYTGLDNVGTIHFARFVIVDNNLCMMSVYDGDFDSYVRDFIVSIGNVFDAVLQFIEDADDVVPTRRNVEKFVAWVHARDVFQLPDFATDLFALQAAARRPSADGSPRPLTALPRAVILQLRANRNVSLGSGFRGYAGFSAAQIRQRLGIGW